MLKSKVMESAEYIKKFVPMDIEIGVILGSGLGDLAEEIEEKIVIQYKDIPNMPRTTVSGHKGQFVIGKMCGKSVIMMQGRFHFYEGHKMDTLALPIYLMKYLGVKNLIVTNAAGGVNESYKPGDLMIIRDHINFSFDNPLIGENDEEIGPRFPDMTRAYPKELREVAKKCADKLNIKLQEGVYLMMTGPTYETPSEIKMARILGGDAVGMSTVPDVISAVHCGLPVLGISCITNMAAGILDAPLNHKEVIETSQRVKREFTSLIKSVIAEI